MKEEQGYVHSIKDFNDQESKKYCNDEHYEVAVKYYNENCGTQNTKVVLNFTILNISEKMFVI